MRRSDSLPPGVHGGREFPLTRWSVVLAAADGDDSLGKTAWEDLCGAYWYPLYSFLRRTGYDRHDAQDATQGFLASLIEKRELQGIKPTVGRFRSFLLGTLKHFLSDGRKRASAQKRGGGAFHFSLNEEVAESRFCLEPAANGTPESHFERDCGLAMLARAMNRLRTEYVARGKEAQFDVLQQRLGGSRLPVPYAELGSQLGMNEGTVKVAVHRLRKEFGRLLRAEIAQTVANESEIDDELRHLIRVTSA